MIHNSTLGKTTNKQKQEHTVVTCTSWYFIPPFHVLLLQSLFDATLHNIPPHYKY